MKKIFTLMAIALGTTITVNAQSDGIVLKNSVDSFSYAVGLSIAKSLKQQGVEDFNAEILSQIMKNVFENKNNAQMSEEVMNQTIQQKLQEFAKKKIDAQKAEGAELFEKNKKNKAIKTLASGVQYEVIKTGLPNGEKPTIKDQVTVHYVGNLINGEEFDSSIKRGQPATFGLTNVIKGWTEILQLMPKGSKWKVYIPSDMAYGDGGRPGIPGGATLIFEIELLDIVHNH